MSLTHSFHAVVLQLIDLFIEFEELEFKRVLLNENKRSKAKLEIEKANKFDKVSVNTETTFRFQMKHPTVCLFLHLRKLFSNR